MKETIIGDNNSYLEKWKYAQIPQGKLSAGSYQTAKSKITKATNVAKYILGVNQICKPNVHVWSCNSTRPSLDSHSFAL